MRILTCHITWTVSSVKIMPKFRNLLVYLSSHYTHNMCWSYADWRRQDDAGKELRSEIQTEPRAVTWSGVVEGKVTEAVAGVKHRGPQATA